MDRLEKICDNYNYENNKNEKFEIKISGVYGKMEIEWIEFLDPITDNLKYINLKTGDSVTNRPENTDIHRADDPNQWWQLCDPKTGQTYYYNIGKQKTVWQRPDNVQVIVLQAKTLQSKIQTNITNGDNNKENKFNKPNCNSQLCLKKNDEFDMDLDFLKCDQSGAKKDYDTMSLKSLRPRTLTLTNTSKPLHNTTSTSPHSSSSIPKKDKTMGKTKPLNFVETSSTLYDTNRIAPALVSPTQLSKPIGDANKSNNRMPLSRHRSQTLTSSCTNEKISFKQLNDLKRNNIAYSSRRRLPRTNPNYVNVDLVRDDGTIKNTYIRFDKSPSYQLHTNFLNHPLNIFSPHAPSSPTLSSGSSSFCSTSTGSHYHQPFMSNSLGLQQTPSPKPTQTSKAQAKQSPCKYTVNNGAASNGIANSMAATTTPVYASHVPNASQLATIQTKIEETNKSLVSSVNTTTEDDEDDNIDVDKQQRQQNRKSNFTSSSKTLCNYPYLDDNMSLKFNNQNDIDDDDNDECDECHDDTDDFNDLKNKEMSSSFNTDCDDIQSPSSLFKHQTFNSPISYPSLNRRGHMDRLSKRVAGRVIDGDLYFNPMDTGKSPISFVNDMFRPNSVLIGGTNSTSSSMITPNLSVKSVGPGVSLQRTLTQPRRSPNTFMNANTNSTTSLHTFGGGQMHSTSMLNASTHYALDLNIHKKGGLFFAKKLSSNDLIKWSKDPIQKPLIRTSDKLVKKEAPELFRLIQVYMGDRKMKNFDVKQIGLDIMIKGWSMAVLRDELYLQIIKQTNCNENKLSLNYGWELMSICLSFFPPSQKFFPYLHDYIESRMNGDYDTMHCELSTYACACMKRLERIQSTGAKKGLKKPTPDEIELSRNTINGVSLFGTTLNEIMAIQNVKCPGLRLPWIQTSLSEAVLRLNGARTEGIFRVPGDLDEVNNLKVKYEKIWCSDDFNLRNLNKLKILDSIEDPHLPASLLKLWYRELYEPLIPNKYYADCIKLCENPYECVKIIENLPDINRYVFTYLIKFLKLFAAADNVSMTKMDANNLSMVMAPNCLRCESDDPKTIMENTKKEMLFIKTLIQHLDTSIIGDMI